MSKHHSGGMYAGDRYGPKPIASKNIGRDYEKQAHGAYKPHIGKKQRVKAAKRKATNGTTPQY